MCEAFLSLGHDVTLTAAGLQKNSLNTKKQIGAFYGVDLKKIKLIRYHVRISKALNAQLGVKSVLSFLYMKLKGNSPDLILSRNLYASYLISFSPGIKFIYETHQLESGWRRLLQKQIVSKKCIKTVVISKALKSILRRQLGEALFDPLILHDAAPFGLKRLDKTEKENVRKMYLNERELNGFKIVAGYFGHLYRGRGIETIKDLARRHPDVAFLIFGGNEEQISILNKTEHIDNFMLMGYARPAIVKNLMAVFDVLLMPYQEEVSIGDKRSDTSHWMSPMKMFEYMASGVPFIASRLPVLEEVLRNNENCLLASHNDINDWSSCLKRLLDNPDLRQKLALKAYSEYLVKYNWISRANKILQFAKK